MVKSPGVIGGKCGSDEPIPKRQKAAKSGKTARIWMDQQPPRDAPRRDDLTPRPPTIHGSSAQEQQRGIKKAFTCPANR